jgi:MoaA/NifB/PqqE/SkfB family radical SAM enzyme
MAFLRYQHSPWGTIWKIGKARTGITRVPLIANLTLTYRCNLRCAYCEVWRDPSPEMDTATILRLVDQIAEAGTERLSLGGGEPMIRRDIGAIIEHAKNRGLTVNLLSNGLQVPRRITELRGLDFLAISLDGLQEVHDQARGKMSFQRAIDAIRTARAAGIEVWTTTVLTSKNIGSLPDILELARNEGVRASFLPVMKEGLKSRNAESLAPKRSVFVDAMNYLITEARQDGTPLAASADLLRFYRDRWGTEFAVPERGAWQGGMLPCQAAKLFCSIAPDGRLYPCNFLHGDATGYSTVELGFSQAFKNTLAPDCAGCWCDSFIEGNLIFNLTPGAILNMIRLLGDKPILPQRQSTLHQVPEPE